jgi:hypothetical protein
MIHVDPALKLAAEVALGAAFEELKKFGYHKLKERLPAAIAEGLDGFESRVEQAVEDIILATLAKLGPKTVEAFAKEGVPIVFNIKK